MLPLLEPARGPLQRRQLPAEGDGVVPVDVHRLSVVAGRDTAKNKSAVSEIEALGTSASAIPVDVLKEESCRALFDNAVKRHGRVDILVNNAGMSIRKQPEQYTLAEWHTVLDSNLTSAFLCSQAAYPAMKKAGGGKIINIGSMMSIFGASFTTPYAASKGGVASMTLPIARELARAGIRVVTIAPGLFHTPMVAQLPAEIQAGLAASIPYPPRLGMPEEYAALVEHIATNRFLNGETIRLDGALRMAPR